jgi:hypothetical protein
MFGNLPICGLPLIASVVLSAFLLIVLLYFVGSRFGPIVQFGLGHEDRIWTDGLLQRQWMLRRKQVLYLEEVLLVCRGIRPPTKRRVLSNFLLLRGRRYFWGENVFGDGCNDCRGQWSPPPSLPLLLLPPILPCFCSCWELGRKGTTAMLTGKPGKLSSSAAAVDVLADVQLEEEEEGEEVVNMSSPLSKIAVVVVPIGGRRRWKSY